MGNFGASWATSGPQNVHLYRLDVILTDSGGDLGTMLMQFWVIRGRVSSHLGCVRTTVHDMLDTPLRATGHH